MPIISKVDHDLKQMTKLLTLTADQQEQLKNILTARNEQIEDLVKQFKANQKLHEKEQHANADFGNPPGPGGFSGPPPDLRALDAARAKLKSIRSEAETKIGDLLTDSQKTTYAAWKEKHSKADAERESEEFRPDFSDMPGRPGGPGF
jgi:hypothetical protein